MKKLTNKGFAVSTVLYGIVIMVFLVVMVLIATMVTNRSNTKDLVKTTEEELNELSFDNYVPKFQFKITGIAKSDAKITPKYKNKPYKAKEITDAEGFGYSVYEKTNVDVEYLLYGAEKKYKKSYIPTEDTTIKFHHCVIQTIKTNGTLLPASAASITATLTINGVEEKIKLTASGNKLEFYAEEGTVAKIEIRTSDDYKLADTIENITINGDITKNYRYKQVYTTNINVTPKNANVKVSNIRDGELIEDVKCDSTEGVCSVKVIENTIFDATVSKSYYYTKIESNIKADSNDKTKDVALELHPISSKTESRKERIKLWDNSEKLTINFPDNAKIIESTITGRYKASEINTKFTFNAKTSNDETFINESVTMKNLKYRDASFNYNCANYASNIDSCPTGNGAYLILEKSKEKNWLDVIFIIDKDDPIVFTVKYVEP